jgi:hypothetical protein
LAVVGLFSIAGCLSPARAAVGDRISVCGAEFRAGGKRVWLNGANAPWHAWNDFGGHYDAGWWDKHFEELHANGINAARVWISCNGDAGINIDTNGLVTVGISMGPKYQSGRCGVDLFSDAVLQAKAGGTPLARLDFYSPHHYDWMTRRYGNPFSESPAAYGLDGGKPAMIGECPAKGTAGRSSTQDYEDAYRNGWQGVQGWTSNGLDANGGLEKLGPATRAFRNNHSEF